MKYIFGPVPSRRLGLSLGIDILPRKTCNMNCVYCELGRGNRNVVERACYTPVDEILSELRDYVSQNGEIFDCITITASGEPTLHRDFRAVVEGIRGMCSQRPVVVLTNSSLIGEDDVREALAHVDLVLPSLDSATARGFARINRPCSDIEISDVINGLASLKKDMRGEMWLEVLVVKDMNDSQEEVDALKDAIDAIQPDKVQLNTVTRPPAEPFAMPVSRKKLEEIRKYLGDRADIIVDFKSKMKEGRRMIIETEILDTLCRRPLSMDDFDELFGDYRDCAPVIENLLARGVVVKRIVQDKIYFSVADPVEYERRT